MSTEEQRGWLAWWGGQPRSLLFDIAVAFCPIAGELYSHGGRLTDTSPPVLVSLIVGFSALLVRRRFPFATAVLVGFMSLLYRSAIGFTEFAMYTVASRCGARWPTWVAGGVNVLATVVTLGLFGSGMGWNDALTVVGFSVLRSALPVLLGLSVFQRQKVLASYRERADQIEREQELLAERAVATERRNIAREMHDVVAHRVGIVSLHAGSLTRHAPDEGSAELARTIQETSATAMSDLRDMLRVLRADDVDGEQAAPTLTGVAELVEGAVRSGANIRLAMPDPVPDIPPTVGRAAYRVVQEALTNVAKHAPHAAVHVAVTADDDEVTVTVTNRRGEPTSGTALPSSGFGLVGMRERVALAGGKVHAGRTEDGGYRVHAVFPRLTDEDTSDTA